MHAGGGAAVLLDVLRTLHGDPLSASVTRCSGILEALSHLAKDDHGRRLMAGPQALHALYGLMEPLLAELELDGDSAVRPSASGRLAAAEHLAELTALLLLQLSSEVESFAYELSLQGGLIQMDQMLKTERPSLKSLALKVRLCCHFQLCSPFHGTACCAISHLL
jgi:hypothetical protein